MLKKSILAVALATLAFGQVAKAQTNLQIFYDFGKDRNIFTTTLEGFYGDNWGNTFFFIDYDYQLNNSAPNGTYFEIARCLNFWQNTKLGALSAHVEWNGGQFASNAWLFGAEYLLHSSDFRYTLTLEVLYKRISGQKDLDKMDPAVRPWDKVSDVPLQFTIVWGCADIFGAKGLTFSGFADFWWENCAWTDNEGNTTKTGVVFISEPQLWYNIGSLFGCPNLNIGGEVEFAYNFAGGWRSDLEFHKNKGLTVAPAAGIKWNF